MLCISIYNVHTVYNTIYNRKSDVQSRIESHVVAVWVRLIIL